MITAATPAQASPAQGKDDGTTSHAGYVSIAEIVIDAPPNVVWPQVLDIGSWIYDFHFVSVAGEVGRAGETKHLWPVEVEILNGIASVAEQERTLDNATVLKTIAAVPDKLWYGVNLPKAEGDARSNGVNLVVLTERDGKTLVTAIRSKESLCPSPASAQATQKHMYEYQPVAQHRWVHKYLPRLKELAEKSHQRQVR
jgi:hypothetical protein